ncbi:MAG: hypothetical protein P4L10_03525 [Acidobacteriaceae bacterium]|nr:hypothetical protein [Acidobacteriaceae bacterium]
MNRQMVGGVVAALMALMYETQAQRNNMITGAEIVTPTEADPGLKTEFSDPNVVVMPRDAARPELVVLLPGTSGRPSGYSLLISTLADDGFRVIGLMYDNKPTEDKACDKTSDVECHRAFREERFTGHAPRATVQNSPEEGIEHRLVMLLKYLNNAHPKDGWTQYLDGDKPAWGKIIISGHSQGSGHAAYIAKHHEVARAVLFSGPYDVIDIRTAPKLAKWLSDDSKTPMDRWYAEYHEHDLGEPIIPMTLGALKVPADHIYVSHLDLTPGASGFHASGTHDTRMVPV